MSEAERPIPGTTNYEKWLWLQYEERGQRIRDLEREVHKQVAETIRLEREVERLNGERGDMVADIAELHAHVDSARFHARADRADAERFRKIATELYSDAAPEAFAFELMQRWVDTVYADAERWRFLVKDWDMGAKTIARIDAAMAKDPQL